MTKSPFKLYRTTRNSYCGEVAARIFYDILTPDAKEQLDMPRGRPKKTNTQADNLTAALDFISIAAKRKEQPYQSHVRLGGKFAVAFDGQLAAGHPIEEELDCCPHLATLQAAVKRCGKSLAIGQTQAGRLSVTGEKLRAVVQCMTSADVPAIFLEPPTPGVALTEDIKEAFKVCGVLASEAGERVVEASVLLQSMIATGTDGKTCIQYYHGIDLPPHMVLPKVFCDAVARSPYKLTSFGFKWDNEAGKPSAVVVYFENGAWLRTVCYADRWPDLPFMENPYNAAPVAEGFFEGVEAVAEHCDDDESFARVYLRDNAIQSHASEEEGAQFAVPGLQGGKVFPPKALLRLAPFAKRIDLTTYPDRAYFDDADGRRIRGVITACVG